MKNYALKTVEIGWDQESYDALAATWSPVRIGHDQKILSQIFNQAALSPVLKSALDWADSHGVKVMIDHVCDSGIDGYYTAGTGVVAIALNQMKDTRQAINVIVHEITHAWQDYNGFMPVDQGLFDLPVADGFIKTAMLEATANAMGMQAQYEYDHAKLFGAFQNIDSIHQDFERNRIPEMFETFQSWFHDLNNVKEYGDYYAQKYAENLGFPDIEIEEPVFELKYTDNRVPHGGFDLKNSGEIAKLGAIFNNEAQNYLKDGQGQMKDISAFLDPKNALSFYRPPMRTPLIQRILVYKNNL